MNLGSYGQGQDEDYKGLLASVRRTRLYYNPVRQSLRKGHSFEAVKPSGPVNTSEAAKVRHTIYRRDGWRGFGQFLVLSLS